MYLVHCKLVESWVKGYCRENGKYMYTLTKSKARRFPSRRSAYDMIRRLDPVWRKHMEVVNDG